jgi:hypothetical protein
MTEDRDRHSNSAAGTDVPVDSDELTDYRLRERLKRERERSAEENRLIGSYHHATIRQSWISFSVGLLLGVVGFVFILWTVYAVVRSNQFDQVEAVKLISGIVTAAYSGLLVWQAREAQQRMAQFYDKLRTDRTADDLFELTRVIDDRAMRSRMKAVLALTAATGDNAKLDADTLARLLENSTFLQEMFDARDAHAMTLAELSKKYPAFRPEMVNAHFTDPNQQSRERA